MNAKNRSYIVAKAFLKVLVAASVAAIATWFFLGCISPGMQFRMHMFFSLVWFALPMLALIFELPIILLSGVAKVVNRSRGEA